MRKILVLILLLTLPLMVAQAQDEPTDVTPQSGGAMSFFYTYTQASGNRFIQGSGKFPAVPGYDVTLGTSPAWVVGGYIQGDFPRWHIRDAIGNMIQVVRPVDSKVPGILKSESGNTTAATSLPVLAVAQGVSGNLKSQDNPTTITHPVPLRDGSIFIQVTYNGDVAIWRNDIELARLPLNVLRDSRPVVSKEGYIALYIDATNQRYVHGILGDNYEGASLVVLALTDTQFGIRARVDLAGEDVFEGLSPFWADIDGDGHDDLVTTVSNSTVGSQIRVYLFNGTEFTAEVNAPAVGQGSRWRHQLAWGAFGPGGENELVAVQTPEINGIVEFYRYNPENNALDLVAQQSGYTSHVIGSINLDMAVGGDFNGDGQPEIVLPSQDRTRIVGLQHTAQGVREMWSLPVNGTLVTNLSALVTPSGALSLAYGTDDGRLRLWLPDETSQTGE